MERKSFLGLVIGVLIGLALLFLAYMFFFQGTETGQNIRNGLSGIFPLGGNVNTPDGTPGTDDPILNPDLGPDGAPLIPRLRKVSLDSAAGFTTYERATSTVTVVGTTTTRATTTEMVIRYIEKSTGHMYDAGHLSFLVPRISNTTLGLFDSATFSNSQSFVGQRFDPDSSLIETYIGSLIRNASTTATGTTPFRTTGTTFSRNPDAIAVRGTSLFTLYEYPVNSEGFLTQTAPVREVKVFSSPLSGWNVEWINANNLLMTTKPNSGYDGYVFSYNPNTKQMRELLGRKAGLTAKVNNTITAGLYTESYDNNFALYSINFTKGTFFQLSFVTLPEKCVFSAKKPTIAYCAVPRPLPPGSYPEDWYKGKVNFNDAIVKIDLDTNTETTLVNLFDESGEQIDAVQLALNERETHLMFLNKRDDFVWSFDLR